MSIIYISTIILLILIILILIFTLLNMPIKQLKVLRQRMEELGSSASKSINK